MAAAEVHATANYTQPLDDVYLYAKARLERKLAEEASDGDSLSVIRHRALQMHTLGKEYRDAGTTLTMWYLSYMLANADVVDVQPNSVVTIQSASCMKPASLDFREWPFNVLTGRGDFVVELSEYTMRSGPEDNGWTYNLMSAGLINRLDREIQDIPSVIKLEFGLQGKDWRRAQGAEGYTDHDESVLDVSEIF